MKGLTLVELLVSTAILIVLVITIFAVLNYGDRSWHLNMGLLDLQQQARLAMDGMVREVRQSSSDNMTINSSGATIEFYLPEVNNSITYYLDSSQRIIREHPTGTTRILAQNINNLSFCCRHSDTVCNTTCSDAQCLEIYLEANTTTARQRELYFNLNEKVRLRNE